MGVIVEYDNTTNRVTRPPYTTGKYGDIIVDHLVNPNLEGLVEHYTNRKGRLVPYTPFRFLVPFKYWKHSNGTIQEMNQGEKNSVDADLVQAVVDRNRTEANKDFDRKKILQAIVLLVKDEINILRDLHGLAPRTNTQIVSAIRNKINNGEVD